MKVKLPRPTSYQNKVIEFLKDGFNSGKTAIVKSVRQSGKSFLSMMILLIYALNHKCRSVYIAPTLQQATMTYKYILNAIQGTPLLSKTNGATFAIELSNGSDILFRSTAQGTSLRGLTVSGILVLDEAAFLKDEDINVVLPFCNAHNAPILAISTPFARQGYFYNTYTLAMSSPTKTLMAFDWSTDPETSRFLTDERKKFYKRTMTRQMYNTEILGQFMTDDGMLFTNIQACILDYTPEHDNIYIGIDFGSGNNGDYTVISAFNDKAEQILIKSTNNMSPMQQVDWLAGIINSLSGKIVKIFAEVNSIGAVYIDALNHKIKNKITKWVTSNKSKQNLVTSLQIALEQSRIKLINDEELITELSAYEMTIKSNNVVVYNGRPGIHDDYVMATMLAYYALHSSHGNYVISMM